MTTARIVGLVTDGGELVAVSEARPPGRSYGTLFHTTFTKETASLAAAITNGTTLRVLLVLPENLDYQKFRRLDQVKLAAELRMAQSSISSAMAELTERGVVERQGKGPVVEWRLSNDYGWRGDVAGFHAFNRKKGKPAPDPDPAPAHQTQKDNKANSPAQRRLRLLGSLPPNTAGTE